MSHPAELLGELVAYRTPNPGGDEPKLATRLRQELKKRGADDTELVFVPRDDGHTQGAYVWARWGTPRLLVNAHIDTVPPNAGWTGDPYVARVADGKLTALGAADTKGAIASILCALDSGKPKDTAIVFSGDEEHSGTCMRAFVASRRAEGIERAIVCEPTSCRVGIRHRGVIALLAEYQGKGGHSSKADHMAAPLAELARLAVAFADWGRAKRLDGPAGFTGMCLNVAKLDGGVAFNVVPEHASLSISARPWPGADVQAVAEELVDLAARTVTAARTRVEIANPSFTTRDLPKFRPLLGQAIDAPVDLGFWTEAAVLAAAGIDAVVYGPGDIAVAHAADEFVPLHDLTLARDAFIAAFEATHGAG